MDTIPRREKCKYVHNTIIVNARSPAEVFYRRSMDFRLGPLVLMDF